MPTKLREGWYQVVNEAFDLRLPGIYEWRISDVGLYVGKAKVLHRRIGDYPNNIRRMLEGLSWHSDTTKNYRLIHHELRKAYEDGRGVSVAILQNCELDDRAERERWWIRKRQEEAQTGGPRVLNSN